MEPEMELDDDEPVGRVLNRREVITLLGSAGAVLLVGGLAGGSALARKVSALAQPTSVPSQTSTSVVPACVVRPEQTEGPYFVDERLNRSDIRSDPSDGSVRDGVPLRLRFNVYQVGTGTCVPFPGAYVDVWHCDALGVYSDAQGDQGGSTAGKKFLRGYQVTNANGVAEFLTIYPGWYQGRTVHIHFKIRTAPDSAQGFDFTSQLYFDDTLTDQVLAQQPYASKGRRSIRNANDGVYRSGGSQLMLQLTREGAGYAATFDIGIAATPVTQPTAQPTAQAGTSYTFPETGIVVAGEFWTAWQGGRSYEDSLYLNGLPITTARNEVSPTDGKMYLTQWFERARFEQHPENQPPYRVLLGLLGTRAAEGRQSETPFRAIANPGGGLRWFPETGHTLGDSSAGGQAIASFWTRLGGLSQFGFPISQPFTEVSKDDGKQYLVQYFERQRLEYHPENRGTRYEVLLGRLGAEQVTK